MYRIRVTLICAALIVPSALSATEVGVETSRAQAAGFLKELRLRLQAGMAESPMAAIAVCQDEAPKIAERWSTEAAIVRRTALRLRQPHNAASEADQATMLAFSKRLAAGESASSVEEFSVTADGSMRYARALVTEAPCLVCHGETLAPAIAKTIGERYPADRATGFRLGDLRGIVVVESR